MRSKILILTLVLALLIGLVDFAFARVCPMPPNATALNLEDLATMMGPDGTVTIIPNTLDDVTSFKVQYDMYYFYYSTFPVVNINFSSDNNVRWDGRFWSFDSSINPFTDVVEGVTIKYFNPAMRCAQIEDCVTTSINNTQCQIYSMFFSSEPDEDNSSDYQDNYQELLQSYKDRVAELEDQNEQLQNQVQFLSAELAQYQQNVISNVDELEQCRIELAAVQQELEQNNEEGRCAAVFRDGELVVPCFSFAGGTYTVLLQLVEGERDVFKVESIFPAGLSN